MFLRGFFYSHSLGTCAGLVNFDNLEINEAAFDHLQLPFAIRHGTYRMSSLSIAKSGQIHVNGQWLLGLEFSL